MRKPFDFGCASRCGHPDRCYFPHGARCLARGPGRGPACLGYYYPEPATTEVYRARADVLPDSDRKRRILFITELTN